MNTVCTPSITPPIRNTATRPLELSKKFSATWIDSWIAFLDSWNPCPALSASCWPFVSKSNSSLLDNKQYAPSIASNNMHELVCLKAIRQSCSHSQRLCSSSAAPGPERSHSQLEPTSSAVRVGKILSSHVSCIVLSMLKMLCTKFEFRAACSQWMHKIQLCI